MNTNTVDREELHTALDDMTGAADVVEATFTPWDADQAAELDAIVRDLSGLERLDAAVVEDAA